MSVSAGRGAGAEAGRHAAAKLVLRASAAADTLSSASPGQDPAAQRTIVTSLAASYLHRGAPREVLPALVLVDTCSDHNQINHLPPEQPDSFNVARHFAYTYDWFLSKLEMHVSRPLTM